MEIVTRGTRAPVLQIAENRYLSYSRRSGFTLNFNKTGTRIVGEDWLPQRQILFDLTGIKNLKPKEQELLSIIFNLHILYEKTKGYSALWKDTVQGEQLLNTFMETSVKNFKVNSALNLIELGPFILKGCLVTEKVFNEDGEQLYEITLGADGVAIKVTGDFNWYTISFDNISQSIELKDNSIYRNFIVVLVSILLIKAEFVPTLTKRKISVASIPKSNSYVDTVFKYLFAAIERKNKIEEM